MKDEKEDERQVCRQPTHPSMISVSDCFHACYDLSRADHYPQRNIQRIKDRRAAKEEKGRYEKMAEKMHRKRVERLKRREKRNKLLKS